MIEGNLKAQKRTLVRKLKVQRKEEEKLFCSDLVWSFAIGSSCGANSENPERQERGRKEREKGK